jgi:Uma2 family endonuclease
MASALAPARRKKPGTRASSNGCRPTWELLRYLPHQGEWTEDEYLALEDRFGDQIRVELSEGTLEVLPVPTEPHQLLILYFVRCLDAFAQAHAPGVVLFSGIRVKLRIGQKTKFREPDVVYMAARHASRRHKEYWEGADLVMEIVSGDRKDRLRDWKIKPRDYAAAGIPEYWVIDPDKKVIRVYTLRGRSYRRHGDFKPGDRATSMLLPGFGVAVNDVFAAANV